MAPPPLPNPCSDQLAVLQLQKWDLTRFQVKISDYSEAFISPTRKMLLLHSHWSEALLLPLNGNSSSPHFEYLDSRRMEPQFDVPFTSKPDNAFSDGSKHPKIKEHGFISNAKSLVWAHCGDVYNHNENAVFEELLLVVGDRGLVIHAFCNGNINAERIGTAHEGMESSWVEWGPSAAALNETYTEGTYGYSRENEECVRGGNTSSKKWLKSFFTKIETNESEGDFAIKFPSKSSFPTHADIVSFEVSMADTVFLKFIRQSLSRVNDRENESPAEGTRPELGFFKPCISIESFPSELSLKCFQVFSSLTHRRIGISITLPLSVVDEDVQNVSTIIVIVAAVNWWGMEWVCAVQLPDFFSSSGKQIEWSDFKFSDDLLVCLSTSGIIFFWDAVGGHFVANIDVLWYVGLKLRSNPVGVKDNCFIETNCKLDNVEYSGGKEIFRRLLVSFHSSLLAVIDQCGVCYVICADDCISENLYSFNKFTPHFQHCGFGALYPWVVAGSEIGCQKILSDILNDQMLGISSGTGLFTVQRDDVKLLKMKKWHIQDKGNVCRYNFSAVNSYLRSPSHVNLNPLRKIILFRDVCGASSPCCFSPFGITQAIKMFTGKNPGALKLIHTSLHPQPVVVDDLCFNACVCSGNFLELHQEHVFNAEAVVCCYQGCLYLVSQDGLYVVLPSFPVAFAKPVLESIDYLQPSISSGLKVNVEKHLRGISLGLLEPWVKEMLERVLLFEGPRMADQLCLLNGLELRDARLCRLQLALHFLKMEEIDQSLNMLVDVNLAEEGVLRVVFAAAYQLFSRVGSDSGVALASKLLTLASCFAIKMVRYYGLLEHKNGKRMFLVGTKNARMFPLETFLARRRFEFGNLRQLKEMSHYLEVIRNLQCRLGTKFGKHVSGLVDEKQSLSLLDDNNLPSLQVDEKQSLSLLDDNNLPSLQVDEKQSQSLLDDNNLPEADGSVIVEMESKSNLLGSQNHGELTFGKSDTFQARNLTLDFRPSEYLDSSNASKQIILHEHQHGEWHNMRALPLENPKDMIARWRIGNLDFKIVVRDALQSDRLPLAVLQLHLHYLQDADSLKEPHDYFSEICDIGRSIAYDLFLKGETGLAVAALERLGEDVEATLRQLVFCSVRRPLRKQLEEEMIRRGYLRPHERDLLERISLIERLYPSSNFWRTFGSRQKLSKEGPASSDFKQPIEDAVQFHCSVNVDNFTIECGDIDGVVLGSWVSSDEANSHPTADEETDFHIGYWTAAAVWSDAWDQRTIDRILLDQPFAVGVHVLYESQFEYYSCHNDWEEVSKLLDMIPSTVLSEGSLQLNSESVYLKRKLETSNDFSDLDYFSPDGKLYAACMHVSNVKIFTISISNMCSRWLRSLIEEKLATRFIFTKDYWEETENVISLLSRSGFLTSEAECSDHPASTSSRTVLGFREKMEYHQDTLQTLHGVMVNHCSRYDLPSLLDLYLDHHQVNLDSNSLALLVEAAGDCHWANWLILSKIKGCEYEESFYNAREIVSRNMISSSKIVHDIDDIVQTVDDIAEGAGEMAALATLLYAPIPIQNCFCVGAINRHSNSSAKCRLENIKPALRNFPTLWRVLASSSSAIKATTSHANTKMFGQSAQSDYLTWRQAIFLSAEGDTSLMQILPFWFPKPVRKLIQIFIQGPLRWNSLLGASDSGDVFVYRGVYSNIFGNHSVEGGSVSWEAAIQNNIKELYVSSAEESKLGVECHLHRGRPLAAFKQLLLARTQRLQLAYSRQAPSGVPVRGLTNIQADMQSLLAPLTQDEELLLSSVMPLAVLHFEDPVLVASCAFLLELCGVSASMLHVDVAVLQQISSFYKSTGLKGLVNAALPTTSDHPRANDTNIAFNLAQALADDYRRVFAIQRNGKRASGLIGVSQQPSLALITIVRHLEKACLPSFSAGETCGSWLLNGKGNGMECRSRQKTASCQWNLVMTFCQMHNLPPSTNYLCVLANDNDWVGFLAEAQFSGFPVHVVLDVASKEFSDPRLRIHVVNVLRGMQSAKVKAGTTSDPSKRSAEISVYDERSMSAPVELFALLAECEKHKNPGMLLLVKARELRWSLLAVVASCFSDVSSLACLTVWLEITASKETSSIKVNDMFSQIANDVGAAVKASNEQLRNRGHVLFHYSRTNAKRRRLMEPSLINAAGATSLDQVAGSTSFNLSNIQGIMAEDRRKRDEKQIKLINDPAEGLVSLAKMVVVLCEHHLFIPLLRAFEMFLPSCALLSFIRFLQAFSLMRLTDASNHLSHFSSSFKDEKSQMMPIIRDCQIGSGWIGSTSVQAANVMLKTCPSPYERRCLLQLLSSADFGDGGAAASGFRRLYWKINIAEPSLRKDEGLYLGKSDALDDAELLTALEDNGDWELARSWARQLEASGPPWTNSFHHVTETQAEAMVTEWKEFLWDVPEERAAVWGHCQTLFVRHSFPALQAGLFFLRHAEAVEKDIPAKELHEMLLYSLQWLSGLISQSIPVYPLHLLREIETRVWLLAVEAEAQLKNEGSFTSPNHTANVVGGKRTNIIDQTASIIARMDGHLNSFKAKIVERTDARENNGLQHHIVQDLDANISSTTVFGHPKTKRRAKNYASARKLIADTEKAIELDDTSNFYASSKNDIQFIREQEDNLKYETSISGWEERLGPAELERAVLSLLEFGQVAAAKQLHHKLSSTNVPPELFLVDVALKFAITLSPSDSKEISFLDLEPEVLTAVQSLGISYPNNSTDPMQVLESITSKCTDGRGRGLCKRIISVVKAARVLDTSFYEAFGKKPVELLQLLCLKAQDSFEEAKEFVETHFMPPARIAQILAESFLKGLLAAHRGGYMDFQKEEGPAPLLWRISDFLKWAELCPSEPEIGHALMRLVITGQEIPHACEVELLILSHHFYKSSACLDGVDVLVALAATRVECYVSEGDFSCLARLVTGVSNFHALNFILGILIENGQLELLLHKYSAAEAASNSGDAVRGFRMAVLAALQHFNPYDLDAFAMVYNHFDMKYETASLLESRALHAIQRWFHFLDRDQNVDLLESMRFYVEAAEEYATIDAGNKTHRACAQASLLSLQIRMPDSDWLILSETNARRALVDQSRFQEALIVAEAYGLNQPSEWAPVIWNQMLKPELTEQFMAEFVAVLPLQSSMLVELARFYRAEMAARGDQSHFSVWLSPGGLPAEWAKHLGRSFRSLLKRTRDLRLRAQLATTATGFSDVIDACFMILDKVPETAGPLVLRRGHGGGYLPLV